MGKTYRKTNPRMTRESIHEYNNTLHIVGDGSHRTDKHSGWELNYGKECAGARKATIRQLRAAEAQMIDRIMSGFTDPDAALWPIDRGTEGWLTH